MPIYHQKKPAVLANQTFPTQTHEMASRQILTRRKSSKSSSFREIFRFERPLVGNRVAHARHLEGTSAPGDVSGQSGMWRGGWGAWMGVRDPESNTYDARTRRACAAEIAHLPFPKAGCVTNSCSLLLCLKRLKTVVSGRCM